MRRRRRWEGGGGDSATVAVHQKRWDHSHYITVYRLEKQLLDRHAWHFAKNVSFCSVRIWVHTVRSRVTCTELVEAVLWEKGWCYQTSAHADTGSGLDPFLSQRSWLKGSYVGQLYPSCLACRQRQTDLHWATVCVSLVLTQMLWNTDCPVTAMRSQNNSLQLITDYNNVK